MKAQKPNLIQLSEKNQLRPDPEVQEKKPRRKFTASYKLRVLQEAENCTNPGEMGALLRREGLYSSNLTVWRRQRDQGILHGMTPKKRGRKTQEKNPLALKVAELERINRNLQNKLKKAEIIIDVQKKISQILQMPDDSNETEGSEL